MQPKRPPIRPRPPAVPAVALAAAAAPAALDPRLLGRPVHLLPGFTARLRDDLAELFRSGMNRRYRAAFEIGDVTIARDPAASGATRWLLYESSLGGVRVAFERCLLLGALHYRYGARHKTMPAPAEVRETATEERLAARLGQQLVETLAARVDAPLGAAAAPHAGRRGALGAPPAAHVWTIVVPVAESALGLQGELRLALDDAWMSRLLRQLAPPRESAKEPAAAAGQAFAHRLQLTLVARLLDKEMPLGALLDVRVGDVIPVSLGATEVLIDEARLFRAVVAERAGKLCLTSFNDLDR
jgi:flagellar motor switch protein FliM